MTADRRKMRARIVIEFADGQVWDQRMHTTWRGLVKELRALARLLQKTCLIHEQGEDFE